MTTSASAFDIADLNGFVDGRIEPGRAAALAEALASDPEARARMDGWKRQNESLRTMFASVLFEPVPVRLVPTGLAPRAPLQPTAAGPVRLPARVVGAVATAIVGVGLIGFALGALASLGTDGFSFSRDMFGRAAADPGRSLVARAAEAHRTYLADAVRPVELTAAEELQLLRWIQHRLDAPLRVPDLRGLGWSLAGGRVIPGSDGPAALLVYTSGTDRLGLTVARVPAPRATRTGPIDVDGPLPVATWGDGGFGYALTTTRDKGWLQRNAPGLRDSIGAQIRGDAPMP